jgi:hypothetical protein
MVAMLSDERITELLNSLDASNSLADVLAVVADLNAAPGGAFTGKLPDRLREWLGKLLVKLREVTREAQAESFSITVGTNVSVSVKFDLP